MKRLFNFILCMGMTVAFVYAQTPATSEPNPFVQDAPNFSLNEPGAMGYESLATQKGSLLIVPEQSPKKLTVAYTLYPQPASNYMAITLETPYATRPSVFLTTTEGERLDLRAIAPMASRQHRLNLKMKTLPEGIYYLHIHIPGVGTSDGMPIIKMDSAPILIQ